MNYFKSRYKKNNSNGVLLGLAIAGAFLICKGIVESGYFIHCIVGIVLLILFYCFYLYFEKRNKDKPAKLGKEFESKYPIIIQYESPKGINPAEAGLLYNLRVDPTDLTSLIYKWKFEKLIDIKTFKGNNTKKEYIKLIKMDEIPLSRPFFESEIFDSIFALSGVKVIEGAFQLRYALMLEDLETHGIKKGRIVKTTGGKNYNKLYTFLVSLFILSIVILLSGNMIEYTPYGLIISLILLFCCIFLGGYMYGGGKLKFTDKGAKLAAHVIGYRNFIKNCDENRIKLFLKDDPMFVDRTLPYATAFGMETEFLNKVSPLIKDWNAKYIMGHKVTIWMKILSFLLKDNENDGW